jgi:acetyl-CoA carboxylase biotin carboxylase subunit
LRKILIANRGEIAVRVIRACRDLGLATVAVYSECDRPARHVRMADEAVPIGGNAPGDSYLRIDRVIDAARETGADAIHPGYGFLAENAAFADACTHAGLAFIGPSAAAMRLLGSKTEARRAAERAGIPVVPGSSAPHGPEAADDDIAREADAVGYPVMVKAVAGGGGKGMRVVGSAGELPSAIRAARSEAAASFGDPSIYIERRLVRPRHVEVQLLADQYGVVLPAVERECSIQRRHQKVVEESPSPAVSPALRASLASAAAALAASVGYTNAGTAEFLVEETGAFYFLEVNTRLQVEHPVTEMVTGIDLVEWQIRIAAGERLTLDAADLLTPRGHAIECRVYAEDPEAGFVPSPGRITSLRAPAGPGIRDDSGVDAGSDVPVYYDPLLSKLLAWGEDRPRALARLRRALQEYQVVGVRTSLPFVRWLVEEPAFVAGRYDCGFLDEVLQDRSRQPFSTADPSLEEVAAIAVALDRASEMAAPVSRVLSGWRNQTWAVGSSSPAPGWTSRARLEGLRA